MAHLLKRDSVAGAYPGDVAEVGDGIKVDGDVIKVVSHRNPAEIPWGDLGVDVVIESTGFFTDREKAAAHLEGGAPRVIVSAPAGGADATFVVGVNDDTFDPEQHNVVSNALVHDQLLRADDQGPRRRLRRRARPDDHHPRLHR